jgi:hypothetical protein
MDLREISVYHAKLWLLLVMFQEQRATFARLGWRGRHNQADEHVQNVRAMIRDMRRRYPILVEKAAFGCAEALPTPLSYMRRHMEPAYLVRGGALLETFQ